MVRRPEQTDPITAIGAREVVIGDIRNPSSWASAIARVQAVYHICPNIHPEEHAIGKTAIDVARAAACQRFVYHSVLHPQTQSMPHHAEKLRVEEALLQSGLAYTILQPAAYMQNVLVGWRDIVEHGRYRIPYAASTRLGMVDLADVAEAAARVLIEPTHSGALYAQDVRPLRAPWLLGQSLRTRLATRPATPLLRRVPGHERSGVFVLRRHSLAWMSSYRHRASDTRAGVSDREGKIHRF
jgi:uncharacterized protein YbjT (DUF2867 family)